MGRVALVQGASRGLGLSIVRALTEVEDIDMVYAASRSPEESPGLVELRERGMRRVRPLTLDVRSESAIARAAEKVAAEQRELHLLVCAAGVLHEDTTQPEKRFEHLHQPGIDHAFRVNAFGPILTARYFLELLRHGGRAVIANISAHAGSITDNQLGGWYSYRASKAAQNMFTRTLALELRRRAPKLVCVALDPGPVDTALSRPFRRNIRPGDIASPDEAGARLRALIDSLTPEDSGHFFRYDGRRLPW